MEHVDVEPSDSPNEDERAERRRASRGATRRLLEERMRSVRDALRSASLGDFSVRLSPATDEVVYNELAHAFNSLVSKQESLVAETQRIARVVGRHGDLSEEVALGAADGGFFHIVEAINELILALGYPGTEATRVLKLVAQGDLSHEMPLHLAGRPLQGEPFELATTVNALVRGLRHMTASVSRLAKAMGHEGVLGPQADPDVLSGAFRELIGDVNLIARTLTTQIRGIAEVIGGIAEGDLSGKLAITGGGEIAILAETINDMLERLRVFAAQVKAVVRQVGVEGKLGAQAIAPRASGIFRELIDDINTLSGTLTAQLRNVALVTTAVARGDLSKKITVDARGEVLELKLTFNDMVDKLRTFSSEVTRVAIEVGIEGKLGGQAEVPGVEGTWKELTDNTNTMALNLTEQVRGIARVVTAVANGDLSQRFVITARGEVAKLADTINDMTATLRIFADQVTSVAREVGVDGKLGGQARVPGASGMWKHLTDTVNMLAGNLTDQVRNIALVTTAVANGDLSRKITVEAKGEVLELKDTINAMVDKLRTFAAEVTRVAREVGTEGRLGGQAEVPDVSGTWKDLTDNVNVMASNLTEQVRQIGEVVQAVATGDLSRKLVLGAKGEIAALADTINDMTATLRTFAEQVTTVAREVGIEGTLGGQAKVPGASGTWKALTENVNQLAANLTIQVRAISEVAEAVTAGDLTRTITVETRGEVLALKDTINQMIENLASTTRTSEEQTWLQSSLARLFALMQGQRSLESLAETIMSEVTPMIGAQHGAIFLAEAQEGETVLRLLRSYAYVKRHQLSSRFGLGEGLVGQCALEKQPILITEIPDDYVHIGSGLGEAPPRCIVVVPVLFEEQVLGVVEFASFTPFSSIKLVFLEQLMFNVGQAINLIGTSMRTEELLDQLKGSNVELESRKTELEEKAALLEERNREVAKASASLRGQAEELAQVSRYKSQFLANMSHEIRTPLNSMMILAQMLASGEQGNLTQAQRDFAMTIEESGRDLLALINQILDLSKVEAGRIETHPEPTAIATVREQLEAKFRPVALKNEVELRIEIEEGAPQRITTDRRLLDQILKNLLSNAFKFTSEGSVRLRIGRASPGVPLHGEALLAAPAVLAFSVTDTGIGVAKEKQRAIFEAFQQADTSITRKYGGTGLGLPISREYARILGGEVTLEESEPGEGSTFTLYLPLLKEDLEEASVPAKGAEAGKPSSPSVLEGAARALEGRELLVVEDDARNLFALTSLLETYGARVVPATGAKEAYRALEEHPNVALVLLDLMMPEIDGYEALREIKKQPSHKDLPIIAFTAKATDVDRRETLAAGFSDYVSKPPDTRTLLAVIMRHLREVGERGEG